MIFRFALLNTDCLFARFADKHVIVSLRHRRVWGAVVVHLQSQSNDYFRIFQMQMGNLPVIFIVLFNYYSYSQRCPLMEDSIELPSDQDAHEINFFVSPNNSSKKQQLRMINTGSQQSLAYSSETHRRYENVERSPIQIQIPNFQTSEKPAQLKKMIRAANLSLNKSPTLQESRSENQIQMVTSKEEPGTRQDRRKTINKKEYSTLSKKYKQMQYALQVQVISSEELRTKVSILTELLEQKIKSSELGYFLSLKNSSRTLKNIDIFLELKNNQKRLKQTQLIIEQQKAEIQRLTEQITFGSARKQNIDLSNCDPMAQIEALIEQKESLFNYIQEMRKEYNEMNKGHLQIVQELQRYQEKEQKYTTIERPKLVQEISERSVKIKELEQEIEQLRMENNLVELRYQSQIQEIKSAMETKKEKKESVGTMTGQKTMKPALVQTDFNDKELQVLKAELKLLKSERDYYIKEFKKRTNESSENYLLKLQLKALSNPQL